MFRHFEWLVAIGENVQQVVGGSKVKSWKGQTLRFQVLCQSFLAQGKLRLNNFKFVCQSIDFGDLRARSDTCIYE